ncbi:MAG: tryptophan dimethylallyltransferase family protein [Hyalangium sp.]|uniref:tryptophan dimethylallyltransferase family protein n=1 Tax=Hyalangium sp. TaxID=2028555 RepID=UPI00389B2F98
MLHLLWGADGSFARRTIYELIELSTGASPAKSQVLRMALHMAGSVTLGALEPVAHAYEARTGKKLAGLLHLRAQLPRSSWAPGAVELDPRPEQEQDLLESIDEAFRLLGALADQLLGHARRRLEVKQAQSAWEPPSLLTFEEFGTARIQALCEAVGYSAQDTETVKRFFTFMSQPWGSRLIGTTPPWSSDITDDHTPFELSLSIDGERPEVRFLMEAQNPLPGPTTLRSAWENGLALNERLNREFGVRLERFEQVKELFEPVDPDARFALWHAFFLKEGRPDIKAYLNPAARGRRHAQAVVRNALERLGFAGAWRCLTERVMRGDERDQLIYFSLDLSAHRAARVKLYVAHQDTTAEELESVMSLGPEYVPGEAWVFCQALRGRRGRFGTARSVLTCLAFTSDDDERPSSVTLHVPVRCYTRNDEESMERIRFLQEPRAQVMLKQAVYALAHRPLAAGTGLIQWASMRRQDGRVRTTFYLATEAYGASSTQLVAPARPLATAVHGSEQRLNA